MIKSATFAELLAQNSKGKVMLVLELIRPDLLDQIETGFEFSKELDIPLHPVSNVFEEFLNKRYLIVEDSLSTVIGSPFIAALHLLANPKFEKIVNSYLFINGKQYDPGTIDIF